MKRRDFLKMSAAAGVLAATGLGLGKFSYAAQAPTFQPALRSGQELEARIDLKTGAVEANPNIVMRHSACLGCYSSCGNRVKIDNRTGQILRVQGNPYNPSSAQPHLPLSASLDEAYLAFSTYQDKGHAQRGALCARGNASLQAHYDPFRILVPLKRADKRGEGKWLPITWEEAVNETTEGGTLFKDLGETKAVEGLRQVHDTSTPLDPTQPELGPKSFQLAVFGGRGDGRTAFASRFVGAYGTANYYSHGYS